MLCSATLYYVNGSVRFGLNWFGSIHMSGYQASAMRGRWGWLDRLALGRVKMKDGGGDLSVIVSVCARLSMSIPKRGITGRWCAGGGAASGSCPGGSGSELRVGCGFGGWDVEVGAPFFRPFLGLSFVVNQVLVISRRWRKVGCGGCFWKGVGWFGGNSLRSYLSRTVGARGIEMGGV